jgi:Protein of unknown function (DUF3467)
MALESIGGATDAPKSVYANVVQMTSGPFDLILDFGFRSPEELARGQEGGYEVVARVAMSLSHAKSMLPLLARVIADYEKQFGPIPSPGFGDLSRE